MQERVCSGFVKHIKRRCFYFVCGLIQDLIKKSFFTLICKAQPASVS